MNSQIIEILMSTKQSKIEGLIKNKSFEEILVNPNNIVDNKEKNLLNIYNNFNFDIKNNDTSNNKSQNIDKQNEQDQDIDNQNTYVQNIDKQNEQDQDIDNQNIEERDIENQNIKNLDKENKKLDKINNLINSISIYNPPISIKYNSCKINQSLSLPLIFKDIFENYINLYRLGVLSKFSFIDSLFCIIDPMYMSYTEPIHVKFKDSLFMRLLNDFNLYFEGKNYRKDGYSKAKMLSALSNQKMDRTLERYISDYFQLDIIVIDIKYNKYYHCSNNNKHFISILILKNDDILEPILCENGQNYFKDIDNILSKYLIEEVKEERKIKEISFNNEDEKKNKLKLLMKMKLNEIINIAEKLEISLIDKNTFKKKNKTCLIDDIKNCM